MKPFVLRNFRILTFYEHILCACITLYVHVEHREICSDLLAEHYVSCKRSLLSLILEWTIVCGFLKEILWIFERL